MIRQPHFYEPQRRFARLRWMVLTVVLIGGAWVAGLFWYGAHLPRDIADTGTVTDAIVVLTGGSERLQTGQQLLERGVAKKLFISGVYRGVEVHQLLEATKANPALLECCVELGHSAQSTMGNAQETSHWARANAITSVRLVTASYHMPRSLLEFKTHMPDVTIIAHPVFPERVRVAQWWRWPGTASLLAREFNKYLIARLRSWLQSRDPFA